MLLAIISIIILIIGAIRVSGKNHVLTEKDISLWKTASIVGIILSGLSILYTLIVGIPGYIMIFSMPAAQNESTLILLGLCTDIIFGIIMPIICLILHIKNTKKFIAMKVELQEKSIIYCEKCGMANPADIAFCTNCGQPIKEERKL